MNGRSITRDFFISFFFFFFFFSIYLFSPKWPLFNASPAKEIIKCASENYVSTCAIEKFLLPSGHAISPVQLYRFTRPRLTIKKVKLLPLLGGRSNKWIFLEDCQSVIAFKLSRLPWGIYYAVQLIDPRCKVMIAASVLLMLNGSNRLR